MPPVELFGEKLAAEFSRKNLTKVRAHMVRGKLARGVVDHVYQRIVRRAFRWTGDDVRPWATWWTGDARPSRVATTHVYLERDLARAVELARCMG